MDLPANNHTYGKASQPDQFGAGQLVTSWNEHQKKEKQVCDRDFGKMNKMCVQNKIGGGKDMRAFRQETNLMKAPKIMDKKPTPMTFTNDACYGKANRPSTPIKGVLQNHYEALAVQEKDEAPKDMRRNKSYTRGKPTKAVELARAEAMKRAQMPSQSSLDTFKMKKFSAVQSRVNTNRALQSSRPQSNQVGASQTDKENACEGE